VKPIISFDAVTKHYRLGRERANLHALVPGNNSQRRYEEGHDAVADLSFALMQGGSLGIIGPNGAGKSTVLRLIAGIIAPTSGTVSVKGSVASMIELGVGFHPDMTGRENLAFSAAVLGRGPRVVREKLDAIVDFADIGAFLDTPIKRYSSGMVARLGFAAATHFETEILVLDEVLAVGDADFQRKCHARIQELTASGVTLVYCSHAIWTIPRLCTEAIFLSNGRVSASGSPEDVIDAYERSQQTNDSPSFNSSSASIHSVSFQNEMLTTGESIEVKMELEFRRHFPRAMVLIVLSSETDSAQFTASSVAANAVLGSAGITSVTCRLPDPPLAAGVYAIQVILYGDYAIPVVDDIKELRIFVANPHDRPRHKNKEIPSEWLISVD
jgi:ABC-type polysaccharide/polyol phosphate transport system ATPase subunit